MADPRTFTLIGEFKDGITPELQKINNQLAALKNSFSNIGGKGARTASRDFGRFAVASKELVNALKEQNQALRSVVEPMRQYRTEVGKTVAAMKKLQTARGGAKGIEETNRALEQQIRLLERLKRVESRGPGYGGGGGRRPPRPPAGVDLGGGMPAGRPMPRAGRGGGAGGSGFNTNDYNMGTFAFAFSLGQGVSQPITNAIVAGFQIGVDLMMKPFQYFANAFGERVQDELSDLKAAGGLLSISKRSQNPFLKDIDEAIQFQQETNETFAKMAGALPGVTNDYVQVGKRLSDTAARIVNTDFSGALAEANRIRATEEGRKFYGQAITGTGPEAQRDVITTLLGELTKKTTIAGLGGRTGAGGIAGAYGLPGITERLLSEDQVSVGKFQRYASVFSDPAVADALQRNVAKINATAMGSVERYKVIQKVLDEIVTPELIEKLRTSVDGVYQGLKSMIFDPDTGLFGLGRNFKKFGKRINQYGQYIDKAGKVVEDISLAADEDLSIFEIIRDVFSNLGQALMPLVEVLPQVFDPLKSVANVLMDARHYAAEFNRTFNQYREGLKALSKVKGNEFLKDTLDVRASLGAINNLFAEFGIISEGEFLQTAKMLKSKDLDIGAAVSDMIDKFFDSNLAETIGEFIGRLVGTVISQIAKMTGFLADKVGGNKLASGFAKGFEAAGGPAAFTAIFKDVFKLMFEGLKFVMKALPWQAYALMAAALVIPAAISGIAMFAAQGIANALMAGFAKGLGGKGLGDMIAKVFQTIFATKNVAVRDLGNVVTDPRRMLPPAKTPGALPTAAIVPKVAKGMNAFTTFFGKIGSFLTGVGPRFLNFFKGFGGILTVVAGALTSIVSLFKGESLAQALAKGAGPVLGAALGAALIPFLGPIGPMIGAAIGGWVGSLDAVTQPLADTFQAVFNTFGTTFDLIVQIGEDLLGVINGLVRMIPGVSQGFNLLRFALFALLSPFKLLEIGINGIYDLYLSIKKNTVGLNKEEEARLNERRTQRATDEFTIQGREAAGFTLAQQKAAEYAKFKEAQFRGDKEAMNRTAEYMKSIDRLMKFRGEEPAKPAKTTTTPPAKITPTELSAFDGMFGKAPTPSKLSAFDGMFSKKPAAGKLSAFGGMLNKPQKPVTGIQQTAQNTFQLNQKAAQQVSAVTTAGKATEAAKRATEQTKTAVVAQKASLSTIQTTITAMYALLASGMLRVQTQMQPGMFPPGFGIPGVPSASVKDPNTGLPLWMSQAVATPKTRYDGGWGDAIATEMKHKPPGSDLVIANSSETIIPAAGGYGMKEFVRSINQLSGALARNAGPSTPVKFDETMRQFVPNPGAGRPGEVRLKPAMAPQAMGGANIVNNFTITQQPGEDGEALANRVATLFYDAMNNAQSASIFG